MEDIGRAVIRYEVAGEILGSIVTHHAGVISRELAKEVPDQAVIEASERVQEQMWTLRQSLDFRDRERVEQVIKQYGQVSRELWDL